MIRNEIIRQYINDLLLHVKPSEERNIKIKQLKDELDDEIIVDNSKFSAERDVLNDFYRKLYENSVDIDDEIGAAITSDDIWELI